MKGKQLGQVEWLVIKLLQEGARVGLSYTALAVANLVKVESVQYGRQQAVNTAIAHLRKRKLLVDVDRCASCGGAQTRGEKNRTLVLTAAGLGGVWLAP